MHYLPEKPKFDAHRLFAATKPKRKDCERCGNPKTVAHHDDYSQPYSVIWLCKPCHTLRHKELGRGQAGRHKQNKFTLTEAEIINLQSYWQTLQSCRTT